MGEITIAVATFGDKEWRERGKQAAEAARKQAPTLHVHGRSLRTARNTLLKRVKTPYVVFLDADDELETGYIRYMEKARSDIRVPRVSYIREKTEGPARYPRVVGHRHDCGPNCLPEGNYIVIGAAVNVKLARKVGGFRDFPWCEDWDLWIRCWQAGASIENVFQAIYRARRVDLSRNIRGSQRERQKWHDQIYAANFT